MTKYQQARRSAIIAQLCELSRNSWRDAKPCDYLPLEAELRKLEAELRDSPGYRRGRALITRNIKKD